MRRCALAAGLTLALGLAGGCATPVNYVAEGAPTLPALQEAHRASLLDDLAGKLVESEIELVELVDASQPLQARPVEGRAPELERFPLVALEAAAFGAAPELRGAEFDLLVADPARPPGLVVTVRHDLDRRLSVAVGGPPVSLEGDAPSADELQRRFGIGPLVDGSSAWTPAERRALGVGLAFLSDAELAYLSGLAFERAAGEADDHHAGFYFYDEEAGRGRIQLLDRAFTLSGGRFVGTPDRAYPFSIHVMLHEIGHAIAKLDREKLYEVYQRDLEKYNRLVEVANQYVEPLNERYRVVERIRSPTEQRRVREDIRTLEREHRKVKRLLGTSRSRLRRVERQLQSPSPIEQAYGELPLARRGPTLYGRTNVEEGFADAFALYHLDPESVKRFSPAVHDWFAAGHHLSAAAYPPLEEVQPPSVFLSREKAASAR